MNESTSQETDSVDLVLDNETVTFDDSVMLRLVKHIRSKNYHAYVLAQPENLPFGHTREDILIVHPEKQS